MLCKTCEVDKPVDAFYRRHSRCKPCVVKKSTANGRARRLREYGTTPEEWAPLSDGPCQVCGRTDRPIVPDHDHASGTFRGAICWNCNVGIGHLGDNVEGVYRALTYLLGLNS